MIRTLFFSIGDANKLATRPKDVPEQSYRKIGVLGAGMMGAGIAHVSAQAGIDVVLLDTSLEAAEKGKGYSHGLLEKRVQQQRIDAAERDQVLARIQPTTGFADLAGCEMVIEAVFEDRGIKADVTRKAEAVMAPAAIFASNTSTLPITGLAEASVRPENFIGLHFFSPVDRMPLVEIIRGRRTSDPCLARAMDYVKRIGKTPIVVNDSRGFYTSRVFGTYVNEGLALLAEGVSPALIDNAGRMAGMPVGPLALADEVSIDLMHKVRKQTRLDLGKDYKGNARSEAVIELMVEKLGRIGKKAGKGFYDYPGDGGKKRLWPGLAEHFKPAAEQPDVADVKRRLLYVQSVETARCLEEKVVLDPKDADVGAILGWGFPPFLGGPVSQMHTLGLERFVADCDRLAQKYGERFAPPRLLRDMAAAGKTFYPA
jgi:3-hydroxyacyl-CoA dehydrogenase/enoyl-CoA hydratase/3-hydroxybutyryl-CoA epimerase